MTKGEAERGIRYLCQVWRKDAGLEGADAKSLGVYTFLAWVRSNHPSYLSFRTTTSVTDDVERWFESEFGQTAWR